MKLKAISDKDVDSAKRALKYIYPYKLRFLIIVTCIVSDVGFGLAEPILWGKLLVYLFNKDFKSVITNLVILLALHVVEIILRYIRTVVFAKFSKSIVFDLRRDIFVKIIHMPVKTFDDTSIGEFTSRLHEDTSSVVNIIADYMVNLIVDVLKVVLIGITMVKISLPLALLVLAAFPIDYFAFVKLGEVLRKRRKEMVEENDNYFKDMQQSLTGIREIKSLGISKSRIQSFLSIATRIKEKGIKIDKIEALSEAFSNSINIFTQLALFGLGGYFILTGSLSMEYYIAFTAYSIQFSFSLLNVTKINSVLQEVLTSLERIFDLMDNFDYPDEKYGSCTIKSVSGSIEFKDVSFQYNEGQSVLRNISFKIPPNRQIAIVGGSGSGKTTIMNLLLRLYRRESGEILLDGVDVNELSEECLRSFISIVRQEPFLFDMTIRENLIISNPDASDNEIYEVCRSAFIHDFIASLPEGYDTLVGENGIKLSGGQKQRLAIARALLKKSKILLFDEATSSLDNESQNCIKLAIDKISENHTVIIIAHRLSTILECDEILVLHAGNIAAKGTHEYLIANCPEYKRLYMSEAT